MIASISAASQPSTTSIPELHGVVFIVDNDVSVREAVGHLIHWAGWSVEAFASAEDFLAHPGVDAPGCLVLDVDLPGLSGLELQRRLAESGQSMPTIFITGHVDIPMTVQAMKAGAIAYLTQPDRKS